MIINIITTFIATAILWLTYRLLFRNCNRFQFNRFMLLSMTAFAFALPFIHFTMPVQIPENVALTQNFTNYIMLQTIVVFAQDASHKSFDWMNLIAAIYIIGVILFLAKLAFNILKINKIAKKNVSETIDGITIVKTVADHIPFSFMNCVFLPKGETDSQILKHEISHVRNHHSFDIIFIEFATAFQWFNPFMRLIKKDLQNIHEYTADRDVIDSGADKTDYMMLILQQCTASGTSARPSASTSIGNNFSYLLTKKRIKMITQKKKTKGLIFKALLTLPVFALLLLANCTTNNNKSSETPKTIAIRFDGEHPTIGFSDSLIIDMENGKSFDIQAIKTDTVFDCGDKFLFVSKGDSATYDCSMIKKNDSIYLAPEQQAEFPGGISQLLTFVSDNILYPQSAKEKGLEGKCYIQFVVDVDGSVTDAECLQGFDDECVAEALRVVNSMPKWKPGKNNGKPVRVQYLMPIAFQLH